MADFIMVPTEHGEVAVNLDASWVVMPIQGGICVQFGSGQHVLFVNVLEEHCAELTKRTGVKPGPKAPPDSGTMKTDDHYEVISSVHPRESASRW